MPKVIGILDGSTDYSFQLEKKDKVIRSKKSWRITFIVLGDNLDQTDEDAVNLPEIPPPLAVWRGALVRGYKVKEVDTIIHPVTGVPAIIWHVTVELDTNFSSDDKDQQDQSPTQRRPTVRWYGETEEEVLEKDPVTGDPVQTDAGEPIILTTPTVHPVLEIKRYEFYPFNPNIMLTYAHRVNSKTFWGAPRGSALMLPMDVEEETIEGQTYAVVTYRVKFKIKPGQEEPWKARVLHHGHLYRPAPGQPPVAAKDKHGNPITVNLQNGTGTRLPDGAEPQYKEFNRFEYADFNALNLGPF